MFFQCGKVHQETVQDVSPGDGVRISLLRLGVCGCHRATAFAPSDPEQGVIVCHYALATQQGVGHACGT